ncbi:hypothetical protein BDZ97DRAFT_1917290 [Flammula alnicola]|nr:hypothetical protein BDZ97DRAFT_1917290 [Flammula alnicola]
MILPRQNYLAWKISVTLLHFVSITFTLVRVGYRWRTRRLWWDDRIVMIPMVADCIYIVTMWFKLRKDKISWVPSDDHTFLYSEWLSSFLCFTIQWGSRICLALSVARIFLPGHPFRIWSFCFIGILILCYLTSTFILTFGCKGWPWWQLDYTRCTTPPHSSNVGALVGTLILDVIADAVLVVGPVIMLWKVKLPPNQRILILVLFSSSILTILGSVIYTILWYTVARRLGPDSPLIFTMTGYIQSAFALLVSNILVVTMLIYHKLRRVADKDDSPRAARREAEDAEKPTTHDQPGNRIEANNFTSTDSEAPSYTVITQLSEDASNPGSSEHPQSSDNQISGSSSNPHWTSGERSASASYSGQPQMLQSGTASSFAYLSSLPRAL